MISITVNGVPYDVPSSAADTNWAADQVAFEQALAAAVNLALTDVTALTPTAFANLTLINSWADAGPTPQSRKEQGDVVRLRGATDTGTSGTVATVLPVGKRPAGTQRFACMVLDGSGLASVVIDNSGNVTISNLTAGADCSQGVSLDGITFSTT